MLGRERPIAWLIIRVSRIPEAPTRVPATISRLLSSVKPDAATARPVNELSSEIRTGTSAPPIGSTKMTPSTRDRTRTIHSTGVDAVTRTVRTRARMASPTMALMTCWPG